MSAHLVAHVFPVGVEEDGAAALVLVHEARVLKVRHEGGLALDASIRQARHLLAVELLPLLAVEVLHGRGQKVAGSVSSKRRLEKKLTP